MEIICYHAVDCSLVRPGSIQDWNADLLDSHQAFGYLYSPLSFILCWLSLRIRITAIRAVGAIFAVGFIRWGLRRRFVVT
jgi:hypothetical protein